MAQLKSTSVTGNLSVTGNVVASQIIKLNGGANQILLANGETDNLTTIKDNISTAQTTADKATNAITTIKKDATIVTFKGIEDKLTETKNTLLGSDTYEGTIKGAYDIAATKLPLSGGNVTGHIYLTGANATSSTANKSQIIFGTSADQHIAISSNNNTLVINPTASSTTNQIVLYLDKPSQFPNGISANITGNLSGTATKATQDADGNVISNTYLKLAGGTVTGPLTIQSTVNEKYLAFQATPNNFIDAGNEFNFIPSEYNGVIYINYKGQNGPTTGTDLQISQYKFWNGRGSGGGCASIEASSYNATSDARLKENFQQFIPKKSILDLPIYKFDFINGTKNQIGCKAQDLQEICPEIVNEDGNGYLSIQESKIVYLLIDEIKKLKGQLDSLNKTIREER